MEDLYQLSREASKMVKMSDKIVIPNPSYLDSDLRPPLASSAESTWNFRRLRRVVLRIQLNHWTAEWTRKLLNAESAPTHLSEWLYPGVVLHKIIIVQVETIARSW